LLLRAFSEPGAGQRVLKPGIAKHVRLLAAPASAVGAMLPV